MSRPPSGPPPVGQSAVVPRDELKRVDLQNYQAVAEAFNRPDRRADLRAMLGSDELVERFLAVALNALATDSDLMVNANPVTIIQAIKDSATLGLEPTGLTGEAIIIRYGATARLQPMYRGYLKRIRNSHKVQDIDCQLVYDRDAFTYGWTEKGGWFKHDPTREPVDPTDPANTGRGGYWGAYAYAVMPSGFVELDVMNEAEINFIRDTFSPSVKAGKPGPWDTSWGEMARKTVLRRLAKRLPQEAVDALLALDALAEQDQVEEVGSRVDVSKARSAALAAVARRGAPLPAIAAPEATEAVSEPTGTEPDAVVVVEDDGPPLIPIT